MDSNDKHDLYKITGLLDLSLLFILFLTDTTVAGKIWIISTLLCHFVFFIALKYVHVKTLDFIHKFVIILPTIAIFITSIYIKLLSLLFLVLLQILWIIKKRCILKLKNGCAFGHGDELNIFVIFLSLILALQIGRNYTILKNSQVY